MTACPFIVCHPSIYPSIHSSSHLSTHLHTQSSTPHLHLYTHSHLPTIHAPTHSSIHPSNHPCTILTPNYLTTYTFVCPTTYTVTHPTSNMPSYPPTHHIHLPIQQLTTTSIHPPSDTPASQPLPACSVYHILALSQVQGYSKGG